MIKVLDYPLKDDDAYYIGKQHSKPNGDGLSHWTIEGIYSSFDLAFKNVDDGEFIVRFPLNKKLPKELVYPKQAWWVIEGKLEKSEVFFEC